MENALIVSCSEKGTDFFSEKLLAVSIKHIIAVRSCGEARRILLERDFDLVVVNSPLKDESGENFAQHIASGCVSQVMLVVGSENFDAVSAVCEDSGILTISKPVNKDIFWTTLKLAIAAQNRLRRVHNENSMLKQKIEDIRIVDRAKWILVYNLNMSEKEAHRYIEKQAMDMRSTKRAIAEGILV